MSDKEPLYSLASDNSKKAAGQYVDPSTGAYYVRHVAEEDMGGRRADRTGSKKGVGEDLYHDPYKAQGTRGWSLETRELNDLRRVVKEKFVDNDRMKAAGFANAPIPGAEPRSVHVPGYRPFSGKKGHADKLPEDPFAYVEPKELRLLIRAHCYVYTVTTYLSPKVLGAKYGSPDPPKSLEDHMAGMRRIGAVHEKSEPYKDGKMLLFRFMEISPEDSDRLRLEDEIQDLTEANLTSFIEDWVAVRLVLKLQKKNVFSILGYFFTVG